MRIADGITAPTEWVANSIRRGMSAECTVIPHGIDLTTWFPGNTHKEYILWNKSRVDRVCDPQPVYDVAELLPDKHFKMTVGKPVHPNIEITGLTPYADIRPVQEASVYLATAQETFGIGILEALACGVPVVGWNWGGQSEILPQEWLAQEGDLQTLAYKLRHVEHNVERCLEIASKYTWEAAMKLYEDVYTRAYRGTKRVSVVIRNYNTAAFLGDAIESVLPQLTQEDECIVVDDCSTDHSEEIAKRYPVKFVKTPQNLYLSGALNFGVAQANGNYILHLDADNMLGPRTIKLFTDALDADRGIDIAYGQVKWVKPDGVTTEDWKTNWPPSKFDIKAQLSHKNQIPCTSMYRRRVYDRTGVYRNRCRVAEDADFWCRATSLGFVPSMVTTAETLIYRNRPGTTSSQINDWPWEAWYDWRGKPPFGMYGPAESAEPVLVSVIIPVGPGHELLLQDALDSLYVQTFKNWECLVVNDTGRVLPWLPSWVKEFYTNKVGPGEARNVALRAAKGPLWMPLDADDYLASDALEKMVVEWRYSRGYVYSDYTKIESGNKYEVVKCPDQACKILKTQMPHVITGLYPRVSNIRFASGYLEDWDFALQMVQAGYCGAHIAEPLVYYRKTSGSRRQAWNDHYQEVIDRWEGENLPCNCKGKPLSNISTAIPLNSKAVRLQYNGNDLKKYYIGQQSGATYAFGTAEGLKIKVVLSEDANGLLGTGHFSLVS